MLHDHQGSNGFFSPFAFAIAATDMAAGVDTATRSQATVETASTARNASLVKSAYSALRSLVASLSAKPETARTV